jgi:hypothetical protein
MVPSGTGFELKRTVGSSKASCGGIKMFLCSPWHCPSIPLSMPLMTLFSPRVTLRGLSPDPSNCSIRCWPCSSSPGFAPICHRAGPQSLRWVHQGACAKRLPVCTRVRAWMRASCICWCACIACEIVVVYATCLDDSSRPRPDIPKQLQWRDNKP